MGTDFCKPMPPLYQGRHKYFPPAYGSVSDSKRRNKGINFCCRIGILFGILLCFIFRTPVRAQSITAYDLISLVNGIRMGNGLGALATDPTLMACAQGTAETMAASQMTWHIGNASGRASAYGYNNGGACFATENFMMGGPGTTLAQIQSSWSDASHMIPMVNPAYKHIGAGVATANGFTYYVVQAAYPSGAGAASYAPAAAVGAGTAAPTFDYSQIIKSVSIATPDANGKIIHEVQEGQTLWSIATAYSIGLDELRAWNSLGESSDLSLGQKLYIPNRDQVGKTPTPETALTVYPTANAQGRFLHTVTEGETLWSISELWHVRLNDLYTANGLSESSSIGLGWELAIPVTATATLTPTPLPTDTPQPTDTPLPSATATVTETPAPAPSGSALGHMPKAGARTYIILGSIGLIGTGAALLFFGRRK